MSSYCANNPEKCDEFCEIVFPDKYDENAISQFDSLSDEEKKQVCDYCDDDRIASYDRDYETMKDRNLNA